MLQSKVSSEKLRMLKKINANYNGKTIGNANAANSIESYINGQIYSLEEAAEKTDDKPGEKAEKPDTKKGEKAKAFFLKVWEVVKNFFINVWTAIKRFFGWITKSIKKLFSKKKQEKDESVLDNASPEEVQKIMSEYKNSTKADTNTGSNTSPVVAKDDTVNTGSVAAPNASKKPLYKMEKSSTSRNEKIYRKVAAFFSYLANNVKIDEKNEVDEQVYFPTFGVRSSYPRDIIKCDAMDELKKSCGDLNKLTNKFKTARNTADTNDYKNITNDILDNNYQSKIFGSLFQHVKSADTQSVRDNHKIVSKIVNTFNLFPKNQCISGSDLNKIIQTSNYKAIFNLFSRSSSNVEKMLNDVTDKMGIINGYCSTVDACIKSLDKTKEMVNNNKLWYAIPTAVRSVSQALNCTVRELRTTVKLYEGAYAYLC
jgi:hypothetical protein